MSATAVHQEQSRLRRYLTAEEITQVLPGVIMPTFRKWVSRGFIAPALSLGHQQFHLHDVIRIQIMLDLQILLGERSTLPMSCAASLSPELIMDLFDATNPSITVDASVSGRFTFLPDSDPFEALRDRLSSLR